MTAWRGALIDVQLDRLWVSLDGANPDCYADVRLGAALPGVITNMKNLYQQRMLRQSALPQIGVAFVAMRRNIADLPELIRLSDQFGAKFFSVSNVLAHTPALQQEMLYQRSMYDFSLDANWCAAQRGPAPPGYGQHHPARAG